MFKYKITASEEKIMGSYWVWDGLTADSHLMEVLDFWFSYSNTFEKCLMQVELKINVGQTIREVENIHWNVFIVFMLEFCDFKNLSHPL